MAVALKSNEAIASAMYIRMSPRKVRRVLDQIRGALIEKP
jgi:ribosomal protein L22